MSNQLHLNAFLMSSGHHEAAWRLTESDPERLSIGMAMELVLVPGPGSDGLTYAFRPVQDDEA